jgi:transposase
MEAYSMDLRVRVMADVDCDMPTVAVAKKYSVSAGWIRKLKRFRRDTGSFAARTQRTSHATKLDADLPRLGMLVQEQPDATLQELRLALGVQVGLATIWRALNRLHLTFKKK